MRLINPSRLVRRAFEGGYAVPAFNTNGGGYDITRAAVEAVAETGAPLILQTYEPNLAYRGARHSAKIAEFLAAGVDVPVALALGGLGDKTAWRSDILTLDTASIPCPGAEAA